MTLSSLFAMVLLLALSASSTYKYGKKGPSILTKLSVFPHFLLCTEILWIGVVFRPINVFFFCLFSNLLLNYVSQSSMWSSPQIPENESVLSQFIPQSSRLQQAEQLADFLKTFCWFCWYIHYLGCKGFVVGPASNDAPITLKSIRLLH